MQNRLVYIKIRIADSWKEELVLSAVSRIENKIKQNWFLFSELVKRDFKEKYKRTALGMVWSLLSPLLNLFVMSMVFSHFFRRKMVHYTIYLFSGNIIMSYFVESTKGGMSALMNNSKIFSKINVSKYLFVLSKSVSSLINFMLTMIVYFIFIKLDHLHYTWKYFMLPYPVICLTVFCIGVSLCLSALYVFFRDTQYLYDVFLTLLRYLSAIFYSIETFSPKAQRMFLFNPVYVFIKYFRLIVIEDKVPSLAYHGLCFFYAAFFMSLGLWIYKRYNHQFIYYI